MKYVQWVCMAILLPISASALSEDQKFGTWTLNIKDGVAYASSTENQGASLGVACNASLEGCFFAIKASQKCVAGEQARYSMKSEVGITAVNAVCQVLGNGETYALLEPFDVVASHIQGSTYVDVSIPQASGDIHTVRVDLSGAKEAVLKANAWHEANKVSVSNGEPLWRGSAYGMTTSEVRKEFPGVVRAEKESKLYGGATELLTLKNVEVVNETFDAAFYFLNDRLTQVTLRHQQENSELKPEQIYETLLDVLHSKYGKELSSENKDSEFAVSKRTIWMSGKTNITLTYRKQGKLPPYLQVVYQQRISSEADKL